MSHRGGEAGRHWVWPSSVITTRVFILTFPLHIDPSFLLLSRPFRPKTHSILSHNFRTNRTLSRQIFSGPRVRRECLADLIRRPLACLASCKRASTHGRPSTSITISRGRWKLIGRPPNPPALLIFRLSEPTSMIRRPSLRIITRLTPWSHRLLTRRP